MSAVQGEYLPPKLAASNFWKTVGIPPRGQKLYKAIREGMPYSVYKRLARAAGLEHKELARYTAIAPATLQRRAQTGRFKPAESDRLYRCAELFKAAVDLFEGDVQAAREWLVKPVRGLGGRPPLDMLGTLAESEAVLELMGRLEHGVIV